MAVFGKIPDNAEVLSSRNKNYTRDGVSFLALRKKNKLYFVVVNFSAAPAPVTFRYPASYRGLARTITEASFAFKRERPFASDSLDYIRVEAAPFSTAIVEADLIKTASTFRYGDGIYSLGGANKFNFEYWFFREKSAGIQPLSKYFASYNSSSSVQTKSWDGVTFEIACGGTPRGAEFTPFGSCHIRRVGYNVNRTCSASVYEYGVKGSYHESRCGCETQNGDTFMANGNYLGRPCSYRLLNQTSCERYYFKWDGQYFESQCGCGRPEPGFFPVSEKGSQGHACFHRAMGR